MSDFVAPVQDRFDLLYGRLSGGRLTLSPTLTISAGDPFQTLVMSIGLPQ
jgi:hypothetical protein